MTNQNPAPALPDGWRLADHHRLGRVIVTNPTPDPSGHVYFVFPDADNAMGYDWFFCPAAELTFLDGPTTEGADTSDAVPGSTLTVGSEWDDADALAQACRESGRDQIVVTESDGDVSVWNKSIDGWTPSWPTVGYEPFTILHAGKKDGQ